jgi:hypothetical protein
LIRIRYKSIRTTTIDVIPDIDLLTSVIAIGNKIISAHEKYILTLNISAITGLSEIATNAIIER